MVCKSLTGGFVELLDCLFAELLKHRGHRMWCDHRPGPSMNLQCWCSECEEVVLCGSQELIEQVWKRYREEFRPKAPWR